MMMMMKQRKPQHHNIGGDREMGNTVCCETKSVVAAEPEMQLAIVISGVVIRIYVGSRSFIDRIVELLRANGGNTYEPPTSNPAPSNIVFVEF